MPFEPKLLQFGVEIWLFM